MLIMHRLTVAKSPPTFFLTEAIQKIAAAKGVRVCVKDSLFRVTDEVPEGEQTVTFFMAESTPFTQWYSWVAEYIHTAKVGVGTQVKSHNYKEAMNVEDLGDEDDQKYILRKLGLEDPRCEFCDQAHCDCEARITCRMADLPGHMLCGQKECGCPKFHTCDCQ